MLPTFTAERAETFCSAGHYVAYENNGAVVRCVDAVIWWLLKVYALCV